MFNVDADREIVHVHVNLRIDAALRQEFVQFTKCNVNAETEQQRRCRVALFHAFTKWDEISFAFRTEDGDVRLSSVNETEVLAKRMVCGFHEFL